MSTSYCSLIPRLFHRSAAFLAALLVTATLSAQPTTVPVISLNGPVTHPTGPVFRYQIATVPGTSPATSYTLVSGAPTFSLDPVTGLVTALVLFPGPASFSFTATNSAGTSPVTTINVTVNPPGPDSTANATVGVPFSFLALGPPGSLSYTATGLAAGLSLDSATGIISGTPTAAGTFRATLNAFNGGTQPSAQGSLTITVAAATAPAVPVISTVGKLTHTTGPVFAYQIELAPGSPAATSYALVSGGPTFSLNSTTGAVTALVLFPGPTSFSVTASNVAGCEQRRERHGNSAI